MKAEQQSTEGIAGILTSIEQQQGILPTGIIVHVRTNCSVHSTEFAGEIDQLPRPPGPSEGRDHSKPRPSLSLFTPPRRHRLYLHMTVSYCSPPSPLQ